MLPPDDPASPNDDLPEPAGPDPDPETERRREFALLPSRLKAG